MIDFLKRISAAWRAHSLLEMEVWWLYVNGHLSKKQRKEEKDHD